MKTETTIVKGIRSKQSTWENLQKLADENEMGNLNHLVNKIFHSYILSVGKKEKELRVSDVIGSKNFNLSYDELLNLLKEAYRNGYATYEMVDVGLEPYDADGYARWVLLGMK